MTELTAIDILIDPDASMIARAKATNARMLQSVPSGFALDEHHQPHITTLQRHVRTADLEQVFAAVAGVSVYQPGNNGTAAKHLRSFPLG